MKDLIMVGKIGSPYGVSGWCKIMSYLEQPKDLFKYQVFFKEAPTKLMTFEAYKLSGRHYTVKFAGMADRDQVAKLTNKLLYVRRDQLDDLLDDEVYYCDLVGLDVFNLEKKFLGKLKSIFETGANDVLVVNDGEKETLIPFIKEHTVKKICLEDKTILVDWELDA